MPCAKAACARPTAARLATTIVRSTGIVLLPFFAAYQKLSESQDGELERLACSFKLDIGNPVALAPIQARLFILALEGCRRASEQRRLYVLECVDADDCIQAARQWGGGDRTHPQHRLNAKYRT